MTMESGGLVSLVYFAGIVGLAVWAGRRPASFRNGTASVWLSLVSLGTLASPFAPANYVLVSLVWLVCMNASSSVLLRGHVWLWSACRFWYRATPIPLSGGGLLSRSALALGCRLIL